jgi:excisionase family DNA binding protein
MVRRKLAMSPRTAAININNKDDETTRSTVKEEEVPRMKTTTTPSPQHLEQALEAFVEDLDGLEGAVQRFEETLLELEEGALEEGALKEGAPEEGAPVHKKSGQSSRLLSPSEVCQELGEESKVVYRRLRSGEIPSLKLGHALKVRQSDLQEYMKGQQQLRSLDEDNSFSER